MRPVPLPNGSETKPLLTPVEVKPPEVKSPAPEQNPFGTPALSATPPGSIVGTAGVVPAPLPGVVGLPTGAPATTLQPPVTEAKTDYDLDLHTTRAGDTYAAVSQAYYGGTQFAAALQAFNKNQPIQQLAEVQVPPLHVIRKVAPARGATPDRLAPGRPAATTDDGPDWGAPGAAQGGQTVYTLFTVPRKGLTLRDVAKTYYGSERSWTKLNNPRNPKFDPDEELPVGTQLQVPTGSVPFR